VGAGVGLGGWPGRGTGVDLNAGIGRGRLGSCPEKAAGFINNPPRVNIASIIMFLVFTFLIGQALEKILCRCGDRTFVAGQLALDCSKGRALRGNPF
jgi:hypothetical protein